MIRWGIIGVGNIAKRFITSLEYSEKGKLTAIASRKEEIRKQFSSIKTYADYNELLLDPEIDAVYIALPHALHAKWSIEALKQHKAVLCEKPAVLSVEEMEQVIRVAKENHTFYMEAMKTRFTPGFKALKEVVQSKVLGELKYIDVNFCSDAATCGKVNPNSYLFAAGQGGSWNDTASYLVAFVLSFYSGYPTCITGNCLIKEGIDYMVQAELEFEKNQKASLITAIDRIKERKAIMEFEKGRIVVDNYNRTDGFIVESKNQIQRYDVPLIVDDFFGQIEEVHDCLNQHKLESDIQTWEETLREIKLIEQVRQCILTINNRETMMK